MISNERIIDQTKKWINEVVVGCNFCPFAANVIKQKRVHYQVETSTLRNICLDSFLNEIARMDKEMNIETGFLIFPNAFHEFDEYLNAVAVAEQLLRHQGFEGVYQVASFHPLYRFAGSTGIDAADFTNRSVYPMLHILREESISRALEHYENPEKIPERNIDFARGKGLTYMKMLRDACF